MSKAEDYIRENTRDGSNKFGGGQHDDCINCPRLGTSRGYIITTTGTNSIF